MIIVFGSINMDLTFMVAHQPAPGETVLCPSYLASPGGKGANQAVAAARDGAQTAMIGCVGQDAFAGPALAILQEAGVDTTGVAVMETPTGCATICVDANAENAIVVASGANRDLRAAQVPDSLFGPETLLLMQMEIPTDENWALLDRAQNKGARTVLNVAPAAPVPIDALNALDFLIVNEIEGSAIARAGGMSPEPPEQLPRQLAERHDLTCILTLGAAGAILHGAEGGYAVPSLAVEPRDTTGAGDTFVGVMAAGLDAGLDPVDAARRASAAAAVACTKIGAQTGIPTTPEIDAVLMGLAAAQPV
ncbi:MAG: ribokinase [Alphaproteobacteria bacterium]|nr:ribokinase [Alphaproteobacteria bacterium]